MLATIVVVLISANFVMSQSVSKLRLLSKDSLVNMAVRKIIEPSFDVKDFDRIDVWVEENELLVEFDHAIRFIPPKGQFYFSVAVDLVTGNISRSIQGEGPQDAQIQFFKLKKKHLDKIKFVMTSINNSMGVMGKVPEGQLPDGTMTITEAGGYYDIEVDSESTNSSYKIRKGTGKIYDVEHKHYAMDQPRRQKIE